MFRIGICNFNRWS